MKKLLALILVLSIGLSFAVAAKDTGKTEEILASVKTRIPSTEEFESFSSSSERNYADGKTYYSFYWSEGSGKIKNMEVTASESGIITYYYVNEESTGSEGYKATVNKPSSDEAMKKAAELLEALNPSLAGKLTVEKRRAYDSLYRDYYDFSVVHTENGIPVLGDSGYVSIKGDLSSIKNFYISFTEGLNYKDYTNAISQEAAKNKFAENIGMALSYKAKYEDGKKTVYASYTPKNESAYIDAVTGEAAVPVTVGVDRNKYFVTADAANASAGGLDAGKLSEAELNELTVTAKLITEDEALEAVKKTGLLDLPENVQTKSSFSKKYNSTDTYYYNFYFSSEEGYWASACVEANTGKIISLYNYPERAKDKERTRDENMKIASKALAVLCPKEIDEGGEYKLEESDSVSVFEYRRYINGIPVDFNSIEVEIDDSTGKFRMFNISKDEMEFPVLDGIISDKDAVKKMFENVSYELLYIPVVENEGDASASLTELVYAIDGYNTEIDAMTGKCVNESETEKIPEYTDISGHWAEQTVKTLARFGIGFPENEFKPDAYITEKEFVALVTAALEYNTGIWISEKNVENFSRKAIDCKIISAGEEVGDIPITRSRAALFFARALGYGEVARLDGIFKTEFNDVTENIGSIAILSGLGILKGTAEGTFSPNESLTRAAAATMIYNNFA